MKPKQTWIATAWLGLGAASAGCAQPELDTSFSETQSTAELCAALPSLEFIEQGHQLLFDWSVTEYLAYRSHGNGLTDWLDIVMDDPSPGFVNGQVFLSLGCDGYHCDQQYSSLAETIHLSSVSESGIDGTAEHVIFERDDGQRACLQHVIMR